jgi:uncharacterized protein
MLHIKLASNAIAAAALLCSLLVHSPSPAAAPVEAPVGTTSQELMIAGGGVILAATLHRPAKVKGLVPAVVIVHGSGPTTREMTTFWTNSALRAGGIAVLVYDKRGTGRSSGTYPQWNVATTEQMFSDLAADAEHAIRWLARQPGIDSKRLGLIGGSQAGWIMPLAASREPLIRFLFIGEGVPLPAGIEEAHSGYLDAVTCEGKIRPTLRQVAAADVLAEDYKGEPGYDPAGILASLDVPMLWTFGLYDEVIPTRMSIERIGELRKQGRANLGIHIFPFGDHNFHDVFSGERYDVSAVIRAWLDELRITRPERSRP